MRALGWALAALVAGACGGAGDDVGTARAENPDAGCPAVAGDGCGACLASSCCAELDTCREEAACVAELDVSEPTNAAARAVVECYRASCPQCN